MDPKSQDVGTSTANAEGTNLRPPTGFIIDLVELEEQEQLNETLKRSFQKMEHQIIKRIDDMAKRIDDLEQNIDGLMTQAGVDQPPGAVVQSPPNRAAGG